MNGSCSRNCRGRSRTPRLTRPRLRASSPTSTPLPSRRALRLPAAGHAQVGVPRSAEGGPAVRRLRGDALRATRSASSRRPARSTSRKAAGPTTGGSRGRCSRRVSAVAISCTTAFPTTSRRPDRCWKPARRRWAARCSPPGSARPSSRCRRWPSCRPAGYVGTPSFLKIILEKADEIGRSAEEPEEGAGLGRGFPAELRRDALRAAASPRYQAYAHGRPRHRSPTRPRRARAWWSTRA